MRLVFATQAIDADDPNLAQTIDMVAALAGRVDDLVVLCDRVRRHELPPNVRFRTFGAPGRVRRGLRFETALLAALRGRRPDAVVVHMVPLFVDLAAPAAKALRVPLVLWYTHWYAGPALRLADRLADAVLSVDRRSYPLAGAKVEGIGHGIDLARFPQRRRASGGEGPLRLLALGRTEPRKNLALLLDAVEAASARGLDLAAEIRGPQVNEAERRHRAALEARIEASPALRGRAAVAEPVRREELAGVIHGADAVVSLTRGETAAGALDKVVYEAAACAVPVVACNPHFDDLLAGHPARLLFRADDAGDLVEALAGLAALPPAARAGIGRELRRRVERRHSADSWAAAVVDTVERLRTGRRPPYTS